MSGKMKRFLTAPTLADGLGVPLKPVHPPPWKPSEGEKALSTRTWADSGNILAVYQPILREPVPEQGESLPHGDRS